jgi:hypothetical protein
MPLSGMFSAVCVVSGDLHVLQSGVDPDLPGRGGRADQVDGVFDRGGQVDNLGRARPAVCAGPCQP